MKLIKSLLLRLLGQIGYLQLTSRIFFLAFTNGLLRRHPLYRTHYLIQNFIAVGQTVIDIGANLGYYSRPLAKIVGEKGIIYSVEPIALYRNVLIKNTSHLPQVKVLPVALGETDGVLVMGNPSSDKHRHGLMRVLSAEESQLLTETYEVPVKNPALLFEHLTQLDYIKCDIEGFEVPVLPCMQPIIEKFRPIMQVETEGDNRKTLMAMFIKLKYNTWFAGKNGLVAYNSPTQHLPGDLIAIPSEKMDRFTKWLSNE